jgi:hypothetical protein
LNGWRFEKKFKQPLYTGKDYIQSWLGVIIIIIIIILNNNITFGQDLEINYQEF